MADVRRQASSLTLAGGPFSKTAKAIHITQFLTDVQKTTMFRVLSRTDEDGRVDSHSHPYSGITQLEWGGAANCRLLTHLLQTTSLTRAEIECYLAYTTKVFEFTDWHEWDSILDFDYHYREMQAEHQFPWGTISPYMELQWLKKKVAKARTLRAKMVAINPARPINCPSTTSSPYAGIGTSISMGHIQWLIWHRPACSCISGVGLSLFQSGLKNCYNCGCIR